MGSTIQFHPDDLISWYSYPLQFHFGAQALYDDMIEQIFWDLQGIVYKGTEANWLFTPGLEAQSIPETCPYSFLTCCIEEEEEEEEKEERDLEKEEVT
jgi:hypothetical protein